MGKYHERKKQGLCVLCGARPPMEGHVMCAVCYERDKEYRKALKSPFKEEKAEKPKRDIESVSKQAYERGVSYGTMVAILEGRLKNLTDD